MFSFSSVTLTRYRNYILQTFSFEEKVVGICGPNGSGKTNLLDALYYLCFTRSYFGRSDQQNACLPGQGFRLEATLQSTATPVLLTCILRETGKKEFTVNGEAYRKFSDHIGRYPAVMIAPDDVELISGGSELRRKFLDTLLSQLDQGYLQNLIAYQKILQQRNSFLKNNPATNVLDPTVLDILDNQLAEKGKQLFIARKNFLSGFIGPVQEHYLTIAGKSEGIAIRYESQLDRGNFEELLLNNRHRDLLLQRTGIGIHRDDLIITLGGEAFKNLASQGQKKSLLFALKLAEYAALKNHTGFSPILLLDDVFEKLDSTRMHNLLHKVCVEENGQVFITDTHPERLRQALEELSVPFQLLELKLP